MVVAGYLGSLGCMNRAQFIGYAGLLAAMFVPVSGAAEQSLTVPPDVVSIVSGGRWKSDTASGTFRVIVQTGGFEHILSRAQIDWIADPTARDNGPSVVASRVAETGSWRLDNPRIFQRAGRWHVEFQALETHFTPALRGRCVVDLGGPGDLKATVRSSDVKAFLQKQ